jgi:alpha-beta hydrolase superfamily lysophospholipase
VRRLSLWMMLVVASTQVSAASAASLRAACIAPDGTELIKFQSGGDTLRGFIDVPATPGKHPAIIIVHGGADTDVTAVSSYWDSLRSAFTHLGIAVLLWDKAGQGCSSGAYTSRLPLRERTEEVLAAIDLLKQRDDIDTTRIGAWALSQGGWVAPMAAVRSSDLAFLILVSGPARDSLSQGAYPSIYLLRQAGVRETEAHAAYETLRRSLAIARAGGTVEELRASVAPLAKYPALMKAFQLDDASSGELRQLLAAPEWWLSADVFLEQLRQPTLAIFGERDAVVDWRESIDSYRRAFARSGNKKLTLRTFPTADHEMLLPRKADDPLTFVPGFLAAMEQWLKAGKFVGQ